MSNPSLHLKRGNFTFAPPHGFQLECGEKLDSVTIRYAVYGEANEAEDNIVLVCHALSGSAEIADWWPELFSKNGVFGDGSWCVIGTNILGSRYGSTGPTSINPRTGKVFASSFPLVTITDIVRAQAVVLDHLGVVTLRAVLGGSIGGMQALEWAIRFPERVENCISIAASPLNALGLALNHIQRQAIALDPAGGLALARELAMCTYKTGDLFQERHGRKPNRKDSKGDAVHNDSLFDVAGYLEYQGKIFRDRFDPDTYVAITRAMDEWDPAKKDGPEVFAQIQAKTTLIGISSDWLFPAADVAQLAKTTQSQGVRCEYKEIESRHGHDAFLAEPGKVNALLKTLLPGKDKDFPNCDNLETSSAVS